MTINCDILAEVAYMTYQLFKLINYIMRIWQKKVFIRMRPSRQFETRVDITSNKFNLFSYNYMHLNEILRMLLWSTS